MSDVQSGHREGAQRNVLYKRRGVREGKSVCSVLVRNGGEGYI